jgi:Zn-dependent peptidase ImmA (M78 family)
LAHELVHIWIGASGISNPKPKKRATELPHDIEQFCNQVAAQLLIPAAGLETIWTDKKTVSDNVRAVATYYRVSTMVALMRAYNLDKMGYTLFSQLLDAEYQRLGKPKKEDDEGGGNFWATFSARNSTSFVKAVTSSLREDKVTYRDAANLLGISVETLRSYTATRFGW